MATLRLEEQLCFALYSASRAVTSAYRPLLDELDLTYPQYLVLLVLWEDDACTIGQLGDRLHLDSGTLSPLIKRLEAAGLVRRQRSNADERRVDVTLTAEGRALEDRAACIPERLLGSTDADPAQLAALRDALNLITAEVYARNG
ncbi:MarR family winged helix-turn-helix transcriptional regulator [Mycolicibacterium sp. OfavD-34-C]|jgi:DNA-binding MarR family transcriptional regulator|uniref:MarR family winged helix-turn-helix transcriptional regulator n=1 Tax=Mycolicibacterium sp. OfavD-34-C TaxID=2917746 RepID=UPI001268DDA2|nr:MarR family transcriptional regulator [Mycolicibacterium sp. OfavD-34-C]MCG7580971.1 MarR family transcriptional regulator [Mycolicibacterium sp. OfavD-34-C]QFS94388.1 Organic hydroperoxide resistance transcriptional regulator [Mycobacterium sp. THAF192]